MLCKSLARGLILAEIASLDTCEEPIVKHKELELTCDGYLRDKEDEKTTDKQTNNGDSFDENLLVKSFREERDSIVLCCQSTEVFPAGEVICKNEECKE